MNKNRISSVQATQTMMIHNLQKLCLVQTINRLSWLIVVYQHNSLLLLYGSNQLRSLYLEIIQGILSFLAYLAQTYSNSLYTLSLLQSSIAQCGTNRISIRVLVTCNKYLTQNNSSYKSIQIYVYIKFLCRDQPVAG